MRNPISRRSTFGIAALGFVVALVPTSESLRSEDQTPKAKPELSEGVVFEEAIRASEDTLQLAADHFGVKVSNRDKKLALLTYYQIRREQLEMKFDIVKVKE